jgi:hypothetical protein
MAEKEVENRFVMWQVHVTGYDPDPFVMDWVSAISISQKSGSVSFL